MTRKVLEEAITEASRFLARAYTLVESGDKRKNEYGSWEYFTRGTAESGDCRRASMDLTRVLAKLRKY